MHLQIIILSIGWGRQIQTWPKQIKQNPGMVEGRAHYVFRIFSGRKSRANSTPACSTQPAC